jgi:very-short-patch-repair endonuclease
MTEYNPKATKNYRRVLRSNLTPAEASLWKILKNRQLNGFKFRRQYGFGPYILDFYCPILKIAIELDGSPHFTDEGAEKDMVRDGYLSEHGISVLRFENNVLYMHQEMVLQAIEDRINMKK